MNALLLTLFILLQGQLPTGVGTLTGRVLSAAGDPMVKVRIALSPYGDGGALIGLTQTDETGHYRIERVPPGPYYVVAGSVDSPTYFSGVTSRARATLVSVIGGTVRNLPDFRVALQPGRLQVTGRVIREWLRDGEVAPPLAVRLITPVPMRRDDANPRTFSADVGADGSFDFPSLPPGQYTLRFFPNVVLPGQEMVIDRDINDLQLPIPLSAMRATVQGTLKVDGVAPMPSPQLVLTNTDQSRPSPSGLWGFVTDTVSIPEVAPEEYAVSLRGLPEGYSVKTITAGSADLLTQPFKVTSSPAPPIVVTLRVDTPMSGVRVVGRLTNPEQSGLPGRIFLRGAVPGLRLLAEILPDGTFLFPAVPPGTYDVELSPSPDSHPRSLTVGKENPTNVEVPLRIPNLRRIAGIIEMPRNTSDPTLLLRFWPILRNAGQPDAPDIQAWRRGRDGAFEFLNVQPGSYQMMLRQQGTLRGPRAWTETVLPVVVADQDIVGLKFIP